jgi:hypothetical protein
MSKKEKIETIAPTSEFVMSISSSLNFHVGDVVHIFGTKCFLGVGDPILDTDEYEESTRYANPPDNSGFVVTNVSKHGSVTVRGTR